MLTPYGHLVNKNLILQVSFSLLSGKNKNLKLQLCVYFVLFWLWTTTRLTSVVSLHEDPLDSSTETLVGNWLYHHANSCMKMTLERVAKQCRFNTKPCQRIFGEICIRRFDIDILETTICDNSHRMLTWKTSSAPAKIKNHRKLQVMRVIHSPRQNTPLREAFVARNNVRFSALESTHQVMRDTGTRWEGHVFLVFYRDLLASKRDYFHVPVHCRPAK